MRPNPYLYAALAASYIGGIVLFIRFMESIGGEGEDGFVVPMAMLSLFTLSAAVMAFLFCYEPIRLLSHSRPNEALAFFLTTTAVFAAFVFGFIALMIFTVA